MDAQRKKGILDVCVLAVLKKGPSYGYKIIRDISRCINISESTLYPILKRLEQNGSLRTYRREYNGRIRKYYELTEIGQKRIDVFLEEWDELRTMYLFIEEENRQEPETPFCGEETGGPEESADQKTEGSGTVEEPEAAPGAADGDEPGMEEAEADKPETDGPEPIRPEEPAADGLEQVRVGEAEADEPEPIRLEKTERDEPESVRPEDAEVEEPETDEPELIRPEEPEADGPEPIRPEEAETDKLDEEA